MKRIVIITIISCAAWMNTSRAQNANDAMLFSRYYSGGTARSAGMSGAFGALGGDLSVLSANPAGLAVYRGTEFTFTPAMVYTNTRAEYDHLTFENNKNALIINNIGYVYTANRYNEKGLKSINFGVAYNRLSDFTSSAYVKRPEATSSLLDEFIFYANGEDSGGIPVSEANLHPFYEGLALRTQAIFYSDQENKYLSDYNLNAPPYGPLYRSMSTKGGIGEYSFSFGANINHKLFLGATLGIQDVYYREFYSHEEAPDFPDMKSFIFSDEYTVNGVGLNFKTGVIFRPIQALRLGAAIHTPTHFWMSPYQLARMDTYWNISPADDGSKHIPKEVESDPSERYRMSTPWRYNLSAASIIGNFAMVDVDLEIVDFSSGNIMPLDTYDIENEDISAILKTAVNLKGGAEIRLGPVYLRGGVAFYGNPYNKNEFDDKIRDTFKSTISYSGGIGFRNRDFYMDAAYTFMKHPERVNNMYMSYNDTSVWYEQATLQTKTGKFILTFGFKF